MFFYPSVLERHTGCFSTIWLAATKGIKIQRRDYLKVNVIRTCDDIIDYVLVRVPPPQPGLPRPRFSLYLSTQLQYGTVIVYHRQCSMLLEEIQSIVARLAKTKTSQRIDLEDHGRQSLGQNALSLLEEYEWAQDPFFGLMHSGSTVPSPNTLMQLSLEAMRMLSPERPLLSSAGSPPPEGLTASSDSITLIERLPESLPSSQFEGEELAEVTEPEIGMIDLLMEQSDQFPEWEPEREARVGGEQERTEERRRVEEIETETQPEVLEDLERRRERETGRVTRARGKVSSSVSPIEPQTSPPPSKDPSAPAHEEAGLPEEMPAALLKERTPVSVPLPQTPPRHEQERAVVEARGRLRESPAFEFSAGLSQDVSPPGRLPARRRRRQLLFIDQQTQISQDALREQLDPLTQTKPLVLTSPPSQARVSPADLLSNPCSTLPGELQLLWQQAATTRPLAGSALQVGERGTDTESEKERERGRERGREREREELSSHEIPRELAESGLSQPDLSAPSLLTMEVSDRDVFREISPMDTPESRGSPVSRSVSRLMDIPEEGEAPLEREVELQALLFFNRSRTEEEEEEGKVVLFHSLLHPMTDRRSVALSFWTLLEKVAARILCVQQDKPYGDIRITPGPTYDQEIMDI